MGYPMSYRRVMSRNSLKGDYNTTAEECDKNSHEENMLALIRGDLRRLEQNTLDKEHLKAYAKHAGCTVGQAKKILEAFFYGYHFQCLKDITTEDKTYLQ